MLDDGPVKSAMQRDPVGIHSLDVANRMASPVGWVFDPVGPAQAGKPFCPHTVDVLIRQAVRSGKVGKPLSLTVDDA